MERPVFVNSIPKSGTYLLAAILEELGLAFTQWHVFETFYDDYTGVPLELARAKPQHYRVRQGVDRTISRLCPGQFAVGHLQFNQRTRLALEGCRVIFLKRDLRECLVSHMRWQAATGRDRSAWTRVEDPRQRMLAYLSKWGRSFINRARSVAEWEAHAHHVFTFGELRRERAPNRVAAAMDLDASPGRAPQDTQDTLTRMPPVDWSCFWSDDAETKFRQLQGHVLNASLDF